MDTNNHNVFEGRGLDEGQNLRIRISMLLYKYGCVSAQDLCRMLNISPSLLNQMTTIMCSQKVSFTIKKKVGRFVYYVQDYDELRKLAENYLSISRWFDGDRDPEELRMLLQYHKDMVQSSKQKTIYDIQFHVYTSYPISQKELLERMNISQPYLSTIMNSFPEQGNYFIIEHTEGKVFYSPNIDFIRTNYRALYEGVIGICEGPKENLYPGLKFPD